MMMLVVVAISQALMTPTHPPKEGMLINKDALNGESTEHW